MKFVIPPSLKREHDELHRELAVANSEPGPVGSAARTVAQLMHPHFVKEEQYALPPLGLLSMLAQGVVTAEMVEVLPMTDTLKRDLAVMLEEHKAIVAALETMIAAATSAGQPEYAWFAGRLILHAQTEEEVAYPAAILVGEYVRLRLGLDKGGSLSLLR